MLFGGPFVGLVDSMVVSSEGWKIIIIIKTIIIS